MSETQAREGSEQGAILVVGATGNIGHNVVRSLVGHGKLVRVLSRDPQRARAIVGEKVEIVQADLTNEVSLEKALGGMDIAYLATNGGDQVQMETNFIRAAKIAGLRQIVKVSLVEATHDTSVTLARIHSVIEEQLIVSGIPSTILRANYFMENFLASANTIAQQGAIYGSAGDGKVAFVSGRDIAAVAVTTLTSYGHTNKIYNITGPEALTFAEAASRIGLGIGKEVKYVNMSDEDFRKVLEGAGMPTPLVEIYVQGQQAVRLGTYAHTTQTVETLTGRAAGTIDQFARTNAALFRGAAAS